jgi:hypothetical protein
MFDKIEKEPAQMDQAKPKRLHPGAAPKRKRISFTAIPRETRESKMERQRKEREKREALKRQKKKERQKEKESHDNLMSCLENSLSNEKFDIIRESGISLRFEAVVDGYWVSNIKFHFSKGENTIKIEYDFYNDNVYSDLELAITVGDKPNCFPLIHLSSVENDKWESAARSFGMPLDLQKPERITEFCLSVMAPISSKNTFEKFTDSLSVITRAGNDFYAGHGGNMSVMFFPSFNIYSEYDLGIYYC